MKKVSKPIIIINYYNYFLIDQFDRYATKIVENISKVPNQAVLQLETNDMVVVGGIEILKCAYDHVLSLKSKFSFLCFPFINIYLQRYN